MSWFNCVVISEAKWFYVAAWDYITVQVNAFIVSIAYKIDYSED